MKKIFYTLGLLLFSGISYGQYISITNQATTYSEDFNSLSNSGSTQSTLPNGWWVAEFPGNFTYGTGTGSSTTGDTYSFGAASATDRSLGGLASNSTAPNFGVRYINNSGSAFTSFNLDLIMEQWRSGGRTGLDSLWFYYAVNGSNDSLGFVRIANGTWTRYSSADLFSKVTQISAATLDGNLPANNQYYGFTVTGLTVNVGDTLYLRWKDQNVGGSDDGLSIDNFRFSVSTALPVVWKSFTATKATDANILRWSTASESNNSHFEIQRSLDGKNYEAIAKIKGAGNSSKVVSYSFNDVKAPAAKTTYYRLKQVDFDGKSEYSKVVSIINVEQKTGLGASLPNPFNTELNVTINAAASSLATVELMDMIGKTHHTSTEQLAEGANKVTIETNDMPNGIYFIRVTANGETFTQKVIKK